MEPSEHSEMLLLAKKDEPVLIMTDDVTTVPDWRERWEKIHEAAGSEIYCLFTRKRHLFKEENLKRGFVTGVHLRGFYDQATIYINRPSLINDVIKWFNLANTLRKVIFEESPVNSQPVDYVRWVPIEMVRANDYNPNSVARIEMQLLYTSISHDGYTQPIVTVWDDVNEKYIIVDGFHRYFVAKSNKDILDRNNGMLPIVVIDKSINERMASTVRHNRARGKHLMTGMSSMVFEMLENGWKDEDICNELGMEPEELIKLKHITGFSKLFSNVEYRKAWETNQQVKLRLEHERKEAKEREQDGEAGGRFY